MLLKSLCVLTPCAKFTEPRAVHILALILGYLGELNFSRAVFFSQEHRFFFLLRLGVPC